MMEECNTLREYDKTVELWRFLLQNQFTPGFREYIVAARAFGHIGEAEELRQIIRSMRETDLEPPLQLCNTLLAVCAYLGRHREAQDCFKELKELGPQPNSWTYYWMMKILAEQSRVNEVFRLYEEMKTQGLKPNSRTFDFLIYLAEKKENYSMVASVFFTMREYGIRPSEEAFTKAINAFQKMNYYDLVDDSLQKFKLQSNTDVFGGVPLFNSILAMHGKKKDVLGMENTIQVMRSAGIRPNTRSYNLLMGAYRLKGKREMVEKYFTELQSLGLMPNETTYNIMIALHVGREEYKMAEAFYEEMRDKGFGGNKWTLELMLRVYEGMGNITTAIRLFEREGRKTIRIEDLPRKTGKFLHRLYTLSGDKEKATALLSLLKRSK
jgi:pentatricopeptide repeat protein